MSAFRYGFVSHAHADNDVCDPYVSAFGRRGVSLYYDRATPQVGHDLGAALDRELQRAGALIVMVTPAALASFWVNEEIGRFFALMAHDPSRLLIPIKLTPCELPPGLAARWWLDATRLTRDEVVEQIVHALEVRGGDPPPQPTATPAPPVLPSDRFPLRLAELGFVAARRNGVAHIVPPLCAVPAGEFLMGSDKRRDPQASDSELPQHHVNLPAYSIARFPVTVAEYACFVEAKHHREPKKWPTQLQKFDHPVVYVSWDDAVDYAAWLATTTEQPWRLLSEAEWEKAARGTDGRIYPWGDTFDRARCNTSKSGKRGTTAVGSYPSGTSPYGVQDMAGNVWEWTQSLSSPYPYTVSDGREIHDSTDNRVSRGGSWGSIARNVRAACRNHYAPRNLHSDVGLRLAVATSAGS